MAIFFHSLNNGSVVCSDAPMTHSEIYFLAHVFMCTFLLLFLMLFQVSPIDNYRECINCQSFLSSAHLGWLDEELALCNYS